MDVQRSERRDGEQGRGEDLAVRRYDQGLRRQGRHLRHRLPTAEGGRLQNGNPPLRAYKLHRGRLRLPAPPCRFVRLGNDARDLMARFQQRGQNGGGILGGPEEYETHAPPGENYMMCPEPDSKGARSPRTVFLGISPSAPPKGPIEEKRKRLNLSIL